MNKKSGALILIFVLLFGLAVFSACNVQQRPETVQPEPNQPAPQDEGMAEDNREAEMLAEKIEDLDEINSATVVLSNNTAWVGVDMKADTEDEVTENIKEEVSSIVKAEKDDITNVHVTADADTVTRLENIARDIADGKPVSGFVKELEEIGRRVTPSTDEQE